MPTVDLREVPEEEGVEVDDGRGLGDWRPAASGTEGGELPKKGEQAQDARSDDLRSVVIPGLHVPSQQPGVQGRRVSPDVEAPAVRQGLETRERDRMSDAIPEEESVEHVLDRGVFLLD